MSERTAIANSSRVVIKIGSALLTANGQGLDRAGIANWVEQIVALHKQGIQVVLVSSGAVAEGMARLGWQERPEAIHNLQAAAAVGQMGLVQAYESCFQQHGIHTAQILLVHDDVSNRTRYLNSRNTLQALLALGVVPVVNENDTVVTEEIRFGDNDTLGALVANLVDADALIILTDQEGVFERDPRQYPDAPLISHANANDSKLDEMAGGSSGPLGRGGMITKIRAARIAARSGSHTIIAYGRRPNVLHDIFTAQAVGTLLIADQQPLAARKKWLAGQLKAGGTLILDDGAVKVVRDAGKSLLAVGVSDVQGDFARGEMVLCTSHDGSVVARGLVNYSADELRQIMGRRSNEIAELLGYHDGDEVIHRDNLVLT